MHKVKILFLCCTILLTGVSNASADKYNLNIDLARIAMLGTLDADAGFDVSQHWTVQAGITFNPWTFKHDGNQFQHRQLMGNQGARYWFWFTHSGWFMDFDGFYGIFNHGGIFGKKTYQGQAGGIHVSGGYALMLSEHVNLNFDIGLKTGFASYTVFQCPACGENLGRRQRLFISPDLGIGLDFIF